MPQASVNNLYKLQFDFGGNRKSRCTGRKVDVQVTSGEVKQTWMCTHTEEAREYRKINFIRKQCLKVRT